MRIVGRTDQGKVRSNNEDFFAIDDVIGLAALADGMGGLNAGEVASERAVGCVFDAFRRVFRSNMELDLDGRSDLLEASVREANRRVYELGQSRFDYHGMGTTLVSASIRGCECALAHVGDSRAYRFGEDGLQQISTDHSVVQQLIEDGVLSRDEARRAPNRNIVTRAIGIDFDVDVDVSRLTLAPNELVMLCSDGLTDVVADLDIEGHFQRYAREPADLVDALIAAALDGGGPDNVSVVILSP
jgi:protein phosphatase